MEWIDCKECIEFEDCEIKKIMTDAFMCQSRRWKKGGVD